MTYLMLLRLNRQSQQRSGVSELPKELVEKMIESAMNHIEMAELDPPPRKAIFKRLREFYSNRSLALVKENPDKRRSRRAALKCNSTLYVSYF